MASRWGWFCRAVASMTAFIGMLALLLALFNDRRFGKPPLCWHRVVSLSNDLRW